MQLITIAEPVIPVRASNLTFGNTLNLSSDSAESGQPRIAATGKNVYVAWVNNTSGNSDILFKASNNNGTSFGPMIKLSNTINGDSDRPQVAAVGNNVYVVWQANISLTNHDTFFRASSNNGTSFQTPINLSSDSVDSTTPELAASANNVYVTWQTATTPPDIVLKGSIDRGASFGTVINLSNNGSKAKKADNEQIAASGKNVFVTWLDVATSSPTSSSPPLTFFTHSSNNGTSFTSLGSISSDQVGDFTPAMATSGNNVYVAWTNDTANTDNTMFRASPNNGTSFNPTINLYKATVTDLNPALASSGPNVYAVWTNATSGGTPLLYRASNNNGASFGNIVDLGLVNPAAGQEVIAASGSNVYIAWDKSNTSNDVYFISSSDSGLTFGNAIDLSPTSSNTSLPSPAITASGTNVYVAWQDDSPVNSNGDILFRGTGSPPSVPDVAVTAIVLSKSFAYSGVSANPIIVNVTASNPGTISETFYVSTKANTTLIGNQTVTLTPGTSQIVTFSWNTMSLARGNYILIANAKPVIGENNLSNNSLTWGGIFTVRLKGDVNNDCTVDLSDLITVAADFGKTLGSAGFNSAADLNNDRVIDLSDIILVAGSFGQSC